MVDTKMNFNSLSNLKNNKDNLMMILGGCYLIIVGIIVFIILAKVVVSGSIVSIGFILILTSIFMTPTELQKHHKNEKVYKKIFGFELDRFGKFFIIFLISSLLFISSLFIIVIPFFLNQYKNKIVKKNF